ncbi:MAG TPA: hypothetical protein ENK18_08265, partial [Deltaproteobacteria bacterium]|nr:hypothetical protein [Deltaproteobacteria bacterium]
MIISLLSSTAFAQSVLVVDPALGPYTTVTAALSAAQPNDTLEIHPGTYAEQVTINVDGLTLQGTDRATVVLEADNIFNPADGFMVADGVSLTVTDLTISGALLHRALRLQGASVTLERVDVRDGAFSGNGALISADETSTLTLSDVLLESGDAVFGRGGLIEMDGLLTATHTTFRGGTTTREAGALYCSATSTCNVSDSVFESNRAGDAGAAWLEGTAGAWRRNLFCDNEAFGGGATQGNGGAVWTTIDVLHDNSVFQDNRADNVGGAVYVAAGTTELINDDLLGNLSLGDGAAVSVGVDGTLGLSNAVIAYSGGPSSVAVQQGAGTATIAYTAFHDNGAMAESDAALGAGVQPHGTATPLISYVAGDCAATTVIPGIGSTLIDAGDPAVLDPDGSISDVGSTGGPSACNRNEAPGDGIDETCDGLELCWADLDGDGLGEPLEDLIESPDLDCTATGEADNPDDVCPGFDDAEDCDLDGVPDGCDPDVCSTGETGTTDTGTPPTDTGTPPTDGTEPQTGDTASDTDKGT